MPTDAFAPLSRLLSGPVEIVLPPMAGATIEDVTGLNTSATSSLLKSHGIEQAKKGHVAHRSRRMGEALHCFMEAVRLAPAEPEHHLMLAICAWQTGRLELVEPHLKQTIALQPSHARGHRLLADWYVERNSYGAALWHSGRAMELSPNDPTMRLSRASVLERASAPADAWRLANDLFDSQPPSPMLAQLYLRLAHSAGRVDAAMRLLEKTLAHPNTGPLERKSLHFSAVRLLDAVGRFDEAFAHARMGHAIVPEPYDPRRMTKWFDRSIQYYTPQKLHDLPRASHHSRRPVFIVGMPRSGTSLVEQIVASHPQVYGGGELGALSRLANLAMSRDPESGGNFPDCLDSISQRTADRMANQYLAEIDSLNLDATYVTDKMPMNFMYMGLISLLFPDCQVIYCLRDPMDTCLSCYLTAFSSGNEFSNNLLHLGAMYRDYRRLMEHWKSVLHFPMLQVRYEDVVSDLEGQTRGILEFLGLPWDARCLRFYDTDRPVITASADQVRRPIYKSSVGRWKNYQKHLGSLQSMLAEYGLAQHQ